MINRRGSYRLHPDKRAWFPVPNYATRAICGLLVWAALCGLPSRALAETLPLGLKDAVAIALRNNHDVVIAQQKLAAANASVKSARTAFFPKLKAQASYTRLDEIPYIDASAFGDFFDPLRAPFEDLVNKGVLDPSTLSGLSGGGPGRIYVGDDDNYVINLSVEQPIFTGFTLRNSLRISQYQRNSARLLLRRTRETVREQVTVAYWDLRSTRKLQEVTQQAIRQLQSHVVDLENMLRTGMAIENDLLRARVALSRARMQDVKVHNAVQLANAALCNLLVIDQATMIDPIDPLTDDDVEFPALDTLYHWAMARRPDYNALGYDVQSLGVVTKIKKAAYFPNIALLANYDWKRPDRAYNPNFYSSWNINLVATLDVFDWGQRHFEIQKAEAEQRRLFEIRRQAEDYIRLEVRRAYLAVQDSRQEVNIASLGVKWGQENYRVTTASYQAGVLTNSDLLDAQTTLTQARIDLVQAKANLKKALIRLRTSVSQKEDSSDGG